MSSDNNAEKINTEIYKSIIEPILDGPIDAAQIRRIEDYLGKIETIIGQLKSDDIGAADAIRKIRELSEEHTG